MMQHILSAVLMISLLFVETVIPGDLPKFGKVSKEELQLSAPPEAPNSNAIYLFEVGELRLGVPVVIYGSSSQHLHITINEDKFKEDVEVIFEKRMRIKILTRTGMKYANIQIPFREGEEIHDLKGIMVLPGGKKIKLKKENVVEELVDSIKYMKLGFPGVEVGSVVEYKYRVESKNWKEIVPWYFQNAEFTRLSQITLEIMPNFDFLFHFQNTVSIEPTVKEQLMPNLEPKIYKKRELTWKMENLPGIEVDSEIGDVKTQAAALHFKLKDFRSNYGYVNFLE